MPTTSTTEEPAIGPRASLRPGQRRPTLSPPRPDLVALLTAGRRGDARKRAGALATLLFTASSVATWVALGVLGPETRRESVSLTVAAALVLALACWLLPWDRWPDRATLAPALAAFALLGLGLGRAGNALHYFLPYYTLTFVYVGLTQPPAWSVRLLPVYAASASAALLGGQTGIPIVTLVVLGLTGVFVGELLSATTTSHRIATRGLEQLLAVRQRLRESTDVRSVAAATTELGRELLCADALLVLLQHPTLPSRFTLVGASGAPLPETPLVIDIARGRSALGTAVRQGRSVLLRNATRSGLLDERVLAMTEARSAAVVPLPGEGEPLGVLVAVWRQEQRGLDQWADRAVALLALEAGHVLATLTREQRLQRAAESDPLTKLPNRRVFQAALNRARPGDAVVLLDLDHFKSVNDRLGHDAGDELLRTFAAHLRGGIRRIDVPARYGGEEFALLQPGAGHEGALRSVTALQERWRATAPVATFSAGVAVHSGGDPAETLRRADAALYAAKDAGRDTVVVADDVASRTHVAQG